MSDLHKLKARQARLRKLKERSHIRVVPRNVEGNRHLQSEVNEEALVFSDMSQEYSECIRNFDTPVSNEEVNALLKTLDDQVDPMGHILEPVFLSLFDGTMRAFKIGTKQGITASRLYSECKSFSYDDPKHSGLLLDSYTEQLNERENITQHDSQSSYHQGEISRDGSTLKMRDGNKMSAAKERHFDGNSTAPDEYGGEGAIFAHKTHAKRVDKYQQRTEIDHAVPCAEICNNLKKNKALTDSDIRDIVNVDENLVATSAKNNRGVTVGKFDKSQAQLQKEVEQGYVEDAKGNRHYLSDDELEVRKNMVGKMGHAQEAMDKKTNQKVLDNLKGNKEVQKRMASDATDAAANQSLGDVIIYDQATILRTQRLLYQWY